MFNLIISYDPETWNSSPAELDRSRVAIEYTADEISERYKFFDENAIEELKSFPTLFVTENETVESRIGYITNIRLRQKSVVFDFEFDPALPSLPIGTIEALQVDIDLGGWELSRTHWAIKDEPLFEILLRKGYLTQQHLDASRWGASQQQSSDPPIIPTPVGVFNTSQVFIVHGHDDIAKLEISAFISSIGLQPIILHQQASSGRTIIEKIEHYSNVGFGVVLYTPCDIGSKSGELTGRYRARQNVVFEHGFLIGKLGRSRVSAVVKGNVETPNDISGVVYVSMDQEEQWKQQILVELRDAGYQV
ncbi:MAG: nucleotide-binding protein [Candidatus Thiodiazotropha sp. (ex Myrtea sp. 'scaly one' KF741663)]|nr:nucleotide-binding protein [Candidatus Thiodiazotropha sp. (ex Myrtea sp. 'scaly one' KF741663)]